MAAAKQLEPQRKTLQASDAKSKLPAGGGDEGTAYLAYRRSIAKGDGTALLPQLSESLKNEIVETMHATAPLSRSALESWERAQGRAPPSLGSLNTYWCQRCSAYHVGHRVV